MTSHWQPEFDHEDVEILSEKTAYSGYCAIKQMTLRFRLFEGGWSKPITREVMHREAKNAAAVLLYDKMQDKVVMIEQLRMGALSEGGSPWLLEIVAGVIDPGQTPESTAKLEAKEEANCDIDSLKLICSYYPTPGISSEMMHIFCGFMDIKKCYGATPQDLSLIHGLQEDGEDIQCHIFSTDEILDLLHQGKIKNSFAIIALQWLEINRASLPSSQ